MHEVRIESHTERRVFRGLSTGWLESGNRQGPILLFLHGFPDGPQIWDKQAEAFAKDFHIVRPYARGVYPSDPAPNISRYGTDGFALDCLSILDEIDPARSRPIVCLGHDLGAAHAWHLSGLLGNRLKALVIFNGASLAQMFYRYRSSPKQLLKSWYIAFMQLPAVPEVFFAAGSLLPEVGGLSLKKVGASFNQYRAFAKEFPKKVTGIKRLSKPTLVLWGKADPYLNPPTLDEFERFASDVQIRILEGGHWIYVEKAQEVNALLKKFFDQIGVLNEKTLQ